MAVERWTDEMLDELASSVSQMRDSLSDVRDSITEIRDSMDSLRITSQVLLQVAAQNQQKMNMFEQEIELMKQRQTETDQRFNILLEEVRYLIRGKQED